MQDPQDFRVQLDAMGEEAVREKLVGGLFGDRRKEIAERWLLERDHQRSRSDQDRMLASMDEQARAARSAKNAAWGAAIAAIIAATVAVVSVTASFL